MEYTKGEWEVGKAHLDIVYGDDWQKRQIAHCYSPNAEANARLIAAAPELYEACQHTIIWLSALIAHSPQLESGKRLAEIINKAIAKVQS